MKSTIVVLFVAMGCWLSFSVAAAAVNPGLFYMAPPAPTNRSTEMFIIGILIALDLLFILRLSYPAWRPLFRRSKPSSMASKQMRPVLRSKKVI